MKNIWISYGVISIGHEILAKWNGTADGIMDGSSDYQFHFNNKGQYFLLATSCNYLGNPRTTLVVQNSGMISALYTYFISAKLQSQRPAL